MAMDAARSKQMAHIRSLSEQMLKLAQDDAWETLADIEPQRRDLIMKFFERPAGEDEAAEIAATIQDVLEIDKEIIARGRQGRDAIRRELNQIAHGRLAVRAYNEAGQ